MKFSFVLFISFCALTLKAQTSNPKSSFNPYAGVVTEETVSGGLSGVYAGNSFSNRFGIGFYFETPIKRFKNKFNKNRQSGGVYGNIVIIQESKVSLSFLLRAGIENDRFVIIAPSLITSYALTKRLTMGLLAGYRYEKPALGFTFGYKFRKL